MRNAETILEGIHYDTGKQIRVTIDGSIIASVQETPFPSAETARLPVIAPGLVDLQVNGYKGVDSTWKARLFPVRMARGGPIPKHTAWNLIRTWWSNGTKPPAE